MQNGLRKCVNFARMMWKENLKLNLERIKEDRARRVVFIGQYFIGTSKILNTRWMHAHGFSLCDQYQSNNFCHVCDFTTIYHFFTAIKSSKQLITILIVFSLNHWNVLSCQPILIDIKLKRLFCFRAQNSNWQCNRNEMTFSPALAHSYYTSFRMYLHTRDFRFWSVCQWWQKRNLRHYTLQLCILLLLSIFHNP